jgi:FkbM family methyltransferase
MLSFLKSSLLRWAHTEDTETIRINHRPFVLIKGTYSDDYDNAWFYELAKHSTYLLDIGSNMGLHTMLAFGAGTLKHAVLVDANAEALSKAATNSIHNKLAHQTNYYKGFVSDQDDGEITFWTVGAGAAGSMYASHAKTAKQVGSSMMVSTITIDTLVSLFHAEPDLIKMDVEGAESKVLQGARETAKKFKPNFFVEMHSMAELSMEQNTTLVLNWCKENNYNAFYLKEHTVLTDPSMIKHRGRCHVLLMAIGKPYPEELKLIQQSDKILEIEKRTNDSNV